MAKKRRIWAAILAALVVAAVGASLFFLVHDAQHDCTGEDCPICSVLAVCQNVLKSLADAFAAAAAAILAAVLVLSVTPAALSPAFARTPITLKVKLLD